MDSLTVSSADQVFNYLDQERYLLTQRLYQIFQEVDNLPTERLTRLFQDWTDLFCPGLTSPQTRPVITNDYACRSCQLLKVLGWLSGNSYTIQAGAHQGQTFTRQAYSLAGQVELTEPDLPGLLQQVPDCLACQADLVAFHQVKLIRTSPWMSQAISYLLVNQLLAETLTSQRLVVAYQCGVDGMLILSQADYQTLADLPNLYQSNGLDSPPTSYATPVIRDRTFQLAQTNPFPWLVATNQAKTVKPFQRQLVVGLLQQLTVSWLLLKPAFFSHGDIGPGALQLSQRAVSFSYQGVVISCPVLLQLSNLQRSSINLPGLETQIRFTGQESSKTCPSLGWSDWLKIYYLSRAPGKVYFRIKQPRLGQYQCQQFLEKAGQEGLPVVTSPLEYYLAVLHFMTEPRFRACVYSQPDLLDWWSQLFLTNDRYRVENQLENLSPKTDSAGLLATLSLTSDNLEPIYLRCDVVEASWVKLKLLASEVKKDNLTAGNLTTGGSAGAIYSSNLTTGSLGASQRVEDLTKPSRKGWTSTFTPHPLNQGLSSLPLGQNLPSLPLGQNLKREGSPSNLPKE